MISSPATTVVGPLFRMRTLAFACTSVVAVSLIFGILVSTVLTLVLIPILYFSYRNRAIKAA